MKTYDELRALIVQCGVHAVFGDYGDGWGIEHNADELARFLVDMQALGVESVLEVGTNWKAGLSCFLHDEMGWRVTSIDTHDYGHTFDGITFLNRDDIAVDPGVFDLVLLAAGHTYAAARHDYEFFRFNATKVVAFHNIAGLRECEGVRDYWREIAYLPGWREDNGDPLKTGYHEIVAHGDKRGGIGYVVLAETKPMKAAAPVKKAPAKRASKPRTKAKA